MKEQKEEYGLFQLRPETFQAKRVKQYEEHIDENGEMLIGLKGN